MPACVGESRSRNETGGGGGDILSCSFLHAKFESVSPFLPYAVAVRRGGVVSSRSMAKINNVSDGGGYGCGRGFKNKNDTNFCFPGVVVFTSSLERRTYFARTEFEERVFYSII